MLEWGNSNNYQPWRPGSEISEMKLGLPAVLPALLHFLDHRTGHVGSQGRGDFDVPPATRHRPDRCVAAGKVNAGLSSQVHSPGLSFTAPLPYRGVKRLEIKVAWSTPCLS